MLSRFLLLRKVSIISTPTTIKTPSFAISRIGCIMNTDASSSSINNRLAVLAQQLRLYKPPPPSEPSFEDNNDVGVPESSVGSNEEKVAKEKEKRAAVLICLFQGNDDKGMDDGLRVILTKRSSALSSHSGEVSLPGGKVEDDDVDDADTATREAKEEIGLDPSLVNVVAVLEPFLSKNLLRVTPVIGLLSDRNTFNPIPNIDEVDDVFDAPLEMFLKDENRKSEEREWMGNKLLIHYFDYETGGKKYLIWGLTAGILIRAASVVYQRPPAFFEQSTKIKLPRVVSRDNKLP